VRDSGIGIAADSQERVFNDFEQIGNVERNLQHGHGLGLAIVRRLAAQLGIEVSLRSAPGRGSVFGFELPAAVGLWGGGRSSRACAVRGDRSAQAAGRRARAAPRARPVLVVEDNAVVADSLFALLRQWEVQPRVYASAAEALALADLRALDAALCDIRLPGALDGIALAERLQQQKPALAIALISADINEATQRLAAERGWHALRKPVQPEELRRVLLRAQRNCGQAPSARLLPPWPALGRSEAIRPARAVLTLHWHGPCTLPWHGPCSCLLPIYAPRTGRPVPAPPDVRRHPLHPLAAERQLASPSLWHRLRSCLHWLLAAMIVGSLGVGLYMTGCPSRRSGSSSTTGTSGPASPSCAVGAAAAVARSAHRPPRCRPGRHAALAAAGYRASHTLMYLLFFAVPLAGWAYSSALGIPVVHGSACCRCPTSCPSTRTSPRPRSSRCTRAAPSRWPRSRCCTWRPRCKHHWIDRDGLMQRMWPGPRKESAR
jgi:CheY-like chemotaxis protein/cytochrome b561